MEPRFEPLASTSGLKVLDPIEKRQFSLVTPNPVSPSAASTADFYFPVSVAQSIRTAAIELPYTISVYVRDTEGTMLADVEPPADVSFPRDEYLVELSSPVKLYLRVESELEAHADTETVRFSFGDETTVKVGARSRHESPAETVTVPDDPEGMMTGLSALSSSLKTTSPERSFPTLRGHPPRIERGERLDVPDDFDPPDTGVTVEVPPEYDKLYPLAPLAFYLGAEVVPGDQPCLRTDAGFEHRLDSDRGYEREIERVLAQTFFLDCVIRTEGYYPVDLAERNAVEPRLDFEFAAVYDRPLAERLETYLDVPYAAVEDAVPTWHRVTFVRPEPENVELLPYVLNDLSLVRTPPSGESIAVEEGEDELWDAIEEFRRSPPEEGRASFRGVSPADAPAESSRFIRTGGHDDRDRRNRNYVSLPETEAVETAWVGEGVPTSGTKLLKAAYEHERTLPDDGIIDVTVVCNDSRMRREWDVVSEIYGSRDDVAIEVDIEFGLGTDALQEVLAEPTDLLHYIGHVDDRGFDCIDGFLDAETLDDVGTKAFLLNACHSLDQGEALVEAGASAGVVSVSEVGNRSAMEFGKTLAKLFHHGFSVGSALELATDYAAVGSRYIGLGDIGLLLTQNRNDNTFFYEVVAEEADTIEVNVYSYPNSDHPIGSLTSIYILEEEKRFLQPVELQSIETQKQTLKGLLTNGVMPIITDGQLNWSDTWSP